MGRFLIFSLLVAACGRPAEPSHARPPVTAPAAADARATDDPFAALLDERAGALLDQAAPQLAALGPRPRRLAVLLRVIWQTVGADPISRIEAMAILLPDGRLRWGVLGLVRDAAAVEVATDLVYPQGVLDEGLRRPLAAADHDCRLPLVPLADVATFPELPREDTFLHGYGLADACAVAAQARGAVWVVSLDWFGVLLASGDAAVLVSAPPRVEGAALRLEAPTVTPMAIGDRHRLVDRTGAPVCDTGPACFDIGERASVTDEAALAERAYGRACELGRGLGCIHLATWLEQRDRADEAAATRTRAVAAFRAACDAEDALECAYLGIALEQGQGVARDEAAAARAYARACEGGAALGCFNLGGLYREGRGVTRSAAKARAHYRRACDLGDEGGCNNAEAIAP